MADLRRLLLLNTWASIQPARVSRVRPVNHGWSFGARLQALPLNSEFVAGLRGLWLTCEEDFKALGKRNFLSDFGPNKSGPIFFRM